MEKKTETPAMEKKTETPAMEKKTETPAEEKVMTPEERKAYLNEEVEIELILDDGRYSDDVVVGVNGKYWQIQRGVPVTIPRYVQQVLENSKRQDFQTMRMLKQKERDYDKKAAAIQA